jgi:hypothetical protein
MSNPTTTLHVPIEVSVRDALTRKAKRLGFDSVQAYIRVWAKADAEDRQLDFGYVDPWGRVPPKAAKRLDRETAEAIRLSEAGELPGFTTVRDMMDYMEHEYEPDAD